MNIEQLRRDHPGLYAECLAAGAQQERKRILAAMPRPSASADEWYTFECIRNGTPLTDSVKAQYSLRTMNRARKQADSEAVVAAVERRMGVCEQQ